MIIIIITKNKGWLTKGLTSGSGNIWGKLGALKNGTETSDKKTTFTIKKKDVGLLKKARKQERLSLEQGMNILFQYKA